MHLHPGTYKNPPRDNVHQPSATAAKRFGSMAVARAIGATGTKRVAVILTQFANETQGNWISGSNLITDLNKVQGYFTQFAAYYNEASYGQLVIQFRFFGANGDSAGNPLGETTPLASGVYTLPHTESYYGCGDEGLGCSGITTPRLDPLNGILGGNYLVRDAIVAARNGGYSQLVNSAAPFNGAFDAVIVVHAGNGNETSTFNGDIWSIFYSQDPCIIGGGGLGSSPTSCPNACPPSETATCGPNAVALAAGFSEGDVDPDTETSTITSPLGVMCHEFGHTLGLPDLYNTFSLGGEPVTGSWEIMDSGPYDSNGTNPAHPGAWDKMHLGWINTLTVASSSNTYTLGRVESASNIVKIPIVNAPTSEYFLVEYRSNSVPSALFDKGIPGSGLLIWHIDDAITADRGIDVSDKSKQNSVNCGPSCGSHYGVSIVTADGNPINRSNEGDPGNAFTDGHVFKAPQSNNFAGQVTEITLAGIVGAGSSATASFQIANIAAGGGQAILKLVNYPNPAGKGYPHPLGAGHTTIQFQTTQPANDYSINIYTLSGDLVRQVGKSDITLQLVSNSNSFAFSTDGKFVYEFAWDLTNGNGAMVAPGVYLYLARVDGLTKVGKAVIIR